jgi:serine protease AprX
MEKNRYLFLLVGLLLLGQAPARAQRLGQYLIVFRDKAGTSFTTNQPDKFLSARAITRRQRQGITITERDLPPTGTYVQGLRTAGAKVLYTSRWLNAALVEATAAQVNTILALPYVLRTETGRVLNNVNARLNEEPTTQRTATKFGPLADVPDYGNAALQLRQMGVDQMHAQGYRGEGMLIGLLDSGFLRANQLPFLRTLFGEKRVVATHDFADREADVYDDHDHGLNVLSTMASDLAGQLYGPAYKASYVLLRTEIAASENPVEEAYWLLGAEFADSVGVDVINSSLGYTTFDNPADNHKYSELNGATTLITRAANWAAEAGMVVCISAGNDGSTAWRYISAPADSPNVLSIGAVTVTEQYVAFSSIGPTADGRIKPDLVALGSNTVIGGANGLVEFGSGTSFSSPLVAGLAAGFWQAFPSLTAAQVRDRLRKSGSLAATPTNTLGNGIPNFTRAATGAAPLAVSEPASVSLYPNPLVGPVSLQVRWPEAGAADPVEVRIMDLTGRLVHQQQAVGQEFVVPFANVGTYLISLTTATKNRTLRFVRL